MSDLVISDPSSDLPVIKRLKTSLQKKCNFNSYLDLEKTVTLANYLFATGELKQATDLLDSFIFSVEYNFDRPDVWNEVVHGAAIRAKIAREAGDQALHKKLVKILVDWWEDAFIDENIYADYLDNYKKLDLGTEEAEYGSQLDRCRFYSAYAIEFQQILEVVPEIDDGTRTQSVEKHVREIIDECYAQLDIALRSKQKKARYEEYWEILEERQKEFMTRWLESDTDRVEEVKEGETLKINGFVREQGPVEGTFYIEMNGGYVLANGNFEIVSPAPLCELTVEMHWFKEEEYMVTIRESRVLIDDPQQIPVALQD